MGEREQASILILFALIVAASFIIFDQRNRINELEQVYDNTRTELNYLEAQYEHLYESYQELSNQTLAYRRQIIQLNQDIDKIEKYESTWRTYRDKYMEALLENARLQGLLLMQEYGDNITKPLVEPRKYVFRIGDTIAFKVESEIALYGSYFTIYDPNGTLVWEGDPLAEWVEVEDYWVPPYYGQTSCMEPMVLRENYTLGNWSYVYWFGELKMGEGGFTVNEALNDYLGIGISDLNESESSEDMPDLGGPVANVSGIAQPNLVKEHKQTDPIIDAPGQTSGLAFAFGLMAIALIVLLKSSKTRLSKTL